MIVYTAITNGYDNVRPIKVPQGWQAICFDSRALETVEYNGWTVVPIANDRLLHRAIKAMPHRYLPKHDRSMWMDANLEVTGNLSRWDKAGFWVMEHPNRQYLYEEIEACIELGKDGEHIRRLNDKYGFQGVVATGVIVRDNRPDYWEFGERWFREIENQSHRDQLSFCYIANLLELDYSLMPFLHGFKKHHHALGRNK